MPVPSLKTGSYCLPLRGRKKKFLIKGGHYTAEDILSITSHYQQPIAAKMLPCKCENAPAQRCAAMRAAKIPAGEQLLSAARKQPSLIAMLMLRPPRHGGMETDLCLPPLPSEGQTLEIPPFPRQLFPPPTPGQKCLWAVLNKLLLSSCHPGFSPHMHISASWKAEGRGTHGLCLRSPVSAIPWSCPACWNMVTYANIISQL